MSERDKVQRFKQLTPARAGRITQEKVYRAIGRFIVEFSQVEYTIRHYLAEEIGIKDQHFTPVVESYDVSMLCNIAKSVFATVIEDKSAATTKANANLLKWQKAKAERQKAKSKEIHECITRFQKINEDRVHVAHGLWVPFKEGGTVHHVSRSKLKKNPKDQQAETLERLATELSELRARLERAFMSLPEMCFSE